MATSAADHDEAGRLKPLLEQARQDLLVAQATVTALAAAKAGVDREQADRARADELAQRKAGAQQELAAAMAAQRQARDAQQEALSDLWACVGAAQAAYRRAIEQQDEEGRAIRRQWQARVTAGEIESMPGHLPSPNGASILKDTEPLIRELVKFTGPEQRARRPAPVATSAPPAGARGAVQVSPW
jgi:hypothetical protein